MTTRRKKEWFDDEAFWRETYSFMFSEKRLVEGPAEAQRIIALTKPKGKDILDLACGPGRHSVPLAKRGFRVTGVDRTKFLLDKAKARARAAKVRIEWVQSDMRDFVRPASFDLALVMFTSFGFFDDKREDVALLKSIYTSLKPSGVCLIDVIGKERLAKIWQPSGADLEPDGTMIIQRREVYDDWTRIRNEWTVLRKGRAKTFRFHHTIYSGQELKDRMEQAGFAKVKLYGSLDGDAYGPGSIRLYVVGRKR